MSGDFAKTYLRALAMSPVLADRFQLDTLSGTVNTTGTTLQYTATGLGIKQFRPGTAGNTAAATIPATDAVPTNKWGWRNNVDLLAFGDKVRTVAGTWPLSIEVVISGATTGPTANITAILYLVSGGVDTTYTEVARGSLGAAAAMASGIKTFNLTGVAKTGPANSRFELHVYFDVTLAAVAVGNWTVGISLNDADTWVDPGVFSALVDRSPSEVVAAAADSPRRVLTLDRRSSEAVGTVTDTPLRVHSAVRPLSETARTVTDAASRQVNFPRGPSELVAVVVESVRRVVTVARPINHSVASVSDAPSRITTINRVVNHAVQAVADSPSRVMAFARRTTEVVQSVIDQAIRVVTAPRNATQSVASVTDTPAREGTFARFVNQVVATVQDIPSKLVTYGRNIEEPMPGANTPPPATVEGPKYTGSVSGDISGVKGEVS